MHPTEAQSMPLSLLQRFIYISGQISSLSLSGIGRQCELDGFLTPCSGGEGCWGWVWPVGIHSEERIVRSGCVSISINISICIHVIRFWAVWQAGWVGGTELDGGRILNGMLTRFDLERSPVVPHEAHIAWFGSTWAMWRRHAAAHTAGSKEREGNQQKDWSDDDRRVTRGH